MNEDDSLSPSHFGEAFVTVNLETQNITSRRPSRTQSQGIPSPPTKRMRKRKTRLSVLQLQNLGTVDEVINLKNYVKSLEDRINYVSNKVDENLGNDYMSNTDVDEIANSRVKNGEIQGEGSDQSPNQPSSKRKSMAAKQKQHMQDYQYMRSQVTKHTLQISRLEQEFGKFEQLRQAQDVDSLYKQI